MPYLPKPHRPSYLPPKQRAKRTPSQAEDQVFYRSAKWRRTTQLYRRLNPLCEASNYEGFIVGAEVTDHIVPIQQGGSKFDERNLMPLCHREHNRKRGFEKNGYCVQTTNTPDGLIPVDRDEILRKLKDGDEQARPSLWI
jgi:5-methylcytosine-specific restriction protein A